MISHFEAISHNHHVPVIAYLLSPQASNLYNNPLYYPQLIEKIEALKKAGEQIVSKGEVDKKTLRKISSTTQKKIAQWQNDATRFWQDLIDNRSPEY